MIIASLFIVGFPFTVLIHETGHALALICSTKEGVARIHQGDFNDTNKETFRLGRIHYHIVWGTVGVCYYKNPGDMTTFQRAVTSLGGPILSAVFTCILFFLFYYHPFNWYINYFITGMFWINLSQFICTIIPVTYPRWMGSYHGMKSDGYRVLLLLKKGEESR